MVEEIEELARLGLKDVSKFLMDDDSDKARTEVALKVLSSYSRIRATRANESGVAVVVAKMMGLDGAALAPIWTQLTGTNASAYVAKRTPPALDGGKPSAGNTKRGAAKSRRPSKA